MDEESIIEALLEAAEEWVVVDEATISEIIHAMVTRRLVSLIKEAYEDLKTNNRSVHDVLIGQPRSSCIILFDEHEVQYLYGEIGRPSAINDKGQVAETVCQRVRSVLEPTGLMDLFSEHRVVMYPSDDLKIRLAAR